MTDEPTCGKGLAEHSAVPVKLGELVDALAENLEMHQRSLDPTDDNARKEHEAYTALATEFRSIATQLKSVAQAMAGYRDLPMGRHDEEMLADGQALAAFATFVKVQEELLALLQEVNARDRQMLDAWQSSGRSE